MQENWSAPTSWDEVCKRASGRRHYNAIRQFRAVFRRRKVARLWLAYGGEWGCQRRIAEELGVSEATISRDLDTLRKQARERDRCPFCGRRLMPWA